MSMILRCDPLQLDPQFAADSAFKRELVRAGEGVNRD